MSIDNCHITTENGKTTLELTNKGPDLGVTGKYKVTVSNSAGKDEFDYIVEEECKLLYIYPFTSKDTFSKITYEDTIML